MSVPYGYFGNFRVYFNRHSEFPKVWSIDLGTQETETPVEGVYFVNIPVLNTEYFRDAKLVEADKFTPSAVISGRGFVRVEGDCAFIDGSLVGKKRKWNKFTLAAETCSRFLANLIESVRAKIQSVRS